ncbi:MAG: NADH-quinone oxidoreductase subunit M [Candidatus Tectomicrobia bacterium]|uniref:NADH-quinone oxidoreductase subunit M n=1 Tax=Tectimicrobiota bacterium TaxID=2528274 RepID=A0A932GNA0_UNCTE|nr:NADH-quinone oxidoreductase subunit M [Candidatus Tectomicrobia bacterium]
MRVQWIRWGALLVSLLDFVLSLKLYTDFNPATPALQFVEKVPWIPRWGVSYSVGVDGISLFLILLTTLLSSVAILSSWKAITERVKEYMASMLLLETGMLGVFVAADLFLFYVFWEVMLVPMYFLIGIWGGPRRIYAAVKFFLYTMVGSLLMLVAILVLFFLNYEVTGRYTFDLWDLYQLELPLHLQVWLFLAFALSFAIKVPMFPFHTWLPDAHVEAPTAGSVILAGVLLKMGTYGFLRFALPLFPAATLQFVPWISWLALIGIIYGALMAFVQKDIKSLVAYSSVSHLGFVMLGIFALNPEGIQGGILQMVNHGLSTGALFLIVGIIYERRHTRLIEEFGGLSSRIPLFATFFMIVTLSSIGLPGLNGFVGEFLILVGTFRSNPLYGVIGAVGVILAAVYMLWMFQKVMFGKITNPQNQNLADMTTREVITLIPLVALIFFIGVFPSVFLAKMETSVSHLIGRVQGGGELRVQSPAPPETSAPLLLDSRDRSRVNGTGPGENLP